MYFDSQRLPDHVSSGIPLGTHVGRTTKNHQTLLWWKWMRQRFLWCFIWTRMALLFVASTLIAQHSFLTVAFRPPKFHRPDLNYSSLDARDPQKLSWGFFKPWGEERQTQKQRKNKINKDQRHILMNRTMNFVWVCWLCTLDFLWSWSAMRGLDWKSQELNTNAGAKACISLLV